MKSFENSSFDVRVKKVRQLYTAYSLRGMFTRTTMAKFANSDYVELTDQYRVSIIKLSGETDVDVHVKDGTYINIPVRTPIQVIDQKLREVYHLQNAVEYVQEIDEDNETLPEDSSNESPVTFNTLPGQESENISSDTEYIEENTVNEEVATEDDEIVEDIFSETIPEESSNESPVTFNTLPAQPRIQTTNVHQNNSYHSPRNNNYNNQQKKK